jgi:Uma2 family endonuclease
MSALLKAYRFTVLTTTSAVAVDRNVKFPLYARAGVPKAWLLDVSARRVEVHRYPTPHGYQDVRRLWRGAPVAPQAFPDLALTIDDLPG